MERKYKLTDEYIQYKGHKLYRIQAIKSFDDVKMEILADTQNQRIISRIMELVGYMTMLKYMAMLKYMTMLKFSFKMLSI